MTLDHNATTPDVQSWFIPIDILNVIWCTISIILALIFLFVIISDKLYQKVAMILITNSCLAELLFGVDLLAVTIFTFHNDLKQIYFYNSLCLFIRYLGYMLVAIQNYSYLLQAIYRYILIVYPSRLFYQSIKFQTCLISLTWICCIIYPILLVFTGQIKYLTDDQIYEMPLELSFLTIFNACYIYIFPMQGIILIYLKMVRCVHEMSKHVISVNRLFHVQRELKMIRRIVLLLFIVVALDFPYQTFIIMSFFNAAPKYHFRIAFSFINVSLIFVLIAILEITEPLKTSLMKRIKRRPTNIIGTVS
ncbi:unnamed protein product [Rotaria sordida]|uniref:G-protein coupled receptors family 1 profile domain-containing protein n=1 Tax=Rotaria sordida TaxID=392033 RepID=A0A814I310_9BILA|nr:unnamed protein product [Rotaria sordida]CAF1067360.1 unnamed protein product [Rotaria sordida]CAF1110459.1 unnamed protein product [Rotaria sordida]CAF1322003.1 unnamed protein product [Rotaria sordida]CAF4215486.1 unnamed protein product [Rotaria sordida]